MLNIGSIISFNKAAASEEGAASFWSESLEMVGMNFWSPDPYKFG